MQHILHLHIEIFSVNLKSRKQNQILSVHKSMMDFSSTLSYQIVWTFPISVSLSSIFDIPWVLR